MDPFSEILSGVKLTGAVFFTAEFSAPWGVATPASHPGPGTGPRAPHLLLYHMVVEGEAMVQVAGGPALELNAGDIVIVPNGHAHNMSSKGAPRPFLNYAIVEAKVQAGDLSPLRAGGGGATSRLVCGYLACNPDLSRPILDALPPVFKVNIRADASGHWLESSILHLVEVAGSGHAGSQAMLAKLSEALVIDALRRYVEQLPERRRGWLTGVRDPVVGRSLSLLHSRVAQPWTVATLAAEVGISRSALVERFSRHLAEPPMTYLTRWRLQLAARSLAGTSCGVAEIAAQVGYESEAAFNRAFKREFGEPPGRYRTQQRAPLPKSV